MKILVYICFRSSTPAGQLYSGAPSPQRRRGTIGIYNALVIKAEGMRGPGDSEVRGRIREEVEMTRKSRKG